MHDVKGELGAFRYLLLRDQSSNLPGSALGGRRGQTSTTKDQVPLPTHPFSLPPFTLVSHEESLKKALPPYPAHRSERGLRLETERTNATGGHRNHEAPNAAKNITLPATPRGTGRRVLGPFGGPMGGRDSAVRSGNSGV